MIAADALTIREATADDVPGLVALGTRFLAWSPYGQLANIGAEDIAAGLRAMLAAGAGCFVAVEGETVVGGLLGIRSSLWFASHIGVAVELAWWVDSDHRGSAGLRLLRQFEAWAASQGLGIVAMSDMDPAAERGRAGDLLTSRGYVLTERAYVKGV